MAERDDPYSRVDYRRFVAWPERIRREWPFLSSVLAAAPVRRVLDLGCGTGEHGRFLAGEGFEVVGIDASEAMLAAAREAGPVPNLQFVLGDLTELESLVAGRFGAAICLGNTLPHLQDQAALERFAHGLRARLLDEAPVVLQILNYEKIFARRQRVLPLNFRRCDAEELVFLRLMDLGPEGRVVFTPSTLRYRPEGEPPLEVVSTQSVPLHGWRLGEIEPVLRAAGFASIDTYGTITGDPYVPLESSDLVVVAR